MNKYQTALKRAFDVAAGTSGLAIVGLPVIFCAAAMGCITGQSPIFTQTRMGKDNKPFKILKIRTMNDLYDTEGKLLPDDQRTPAFGAFLRKTRLDELPQLVNIIKGDMSFVGPRPHPVNDVLSGDTLRHTVKPGLTGLAQVKGANVISYAKTLDYDHDYVDHQSLRQDFQIFMATPLRIFKNWHQPHFRAERQYTHHV